MDDDCEYPQFFTERSHVAKKNHVCCECKKTIFAGDRYEYFSGYSDSHFWTAKQHTHCADFCRFVNHRTDLIQDGCTPFGETINDLKEIAGNRYADPFRGVANQLIWFFRAMTSACNERFEQGCGI